MKDSPNDAVQCALRLLRYRGRSEKELSDRLKLKGFSDRTISDAIDRLKKTGLVDDAALARSLDEIAKNVKLLGNRGTEFFLKKRGISDDLIPGEKSGDPGEFERALAFISKNRKTFDSCPVEKRARKIQGALLRRGYSFETVKKVVDTLYRAGE